MNEQQGNGTVNKITVYPGGGSIREILPRGWAKTLSEHLADMTREDEEAAKQRAQTKGQHEATI